MCSAPRKVSSRGTVESPRNKRLIIAQPSAELKQGAHQHYLSGFSLSQNNLLKISCTVSATPPNNVFPQHRSLPAPHSPGSPGGARSLVGSRCVLSLPGFLPECGHWTVKDRAEGKLRLGPSLPAVQVDVHLVSFLGACQGSPALARSSDPGILLSQLVLSHPQPPHKGPQN